MEEVTDPVAAPLPQTLLPRLLREVAARRRRRRWVTGLSAAAAAVVIATGAGVLGSSLAPDQRPATPPAAASTAPGRDLVAVVPSPVTASVAMVPMAWGTRLDLRCDYYASGGGTASREYTLVVHDRAGRSQQVAAWQALPDKRALPDRGELVAPPGHRRRRGAVPRRAGPAAAGELAPRRPLPQGRLVSASVLALLPGSCSGPSVGVEGQLGSGVGGRAGQ